jgi:hypothetical protein
MKRAEKKRRKGNQRINAEKQQFYSFSKRGGQ